MTRPSDRAFSIEKEVKNLYAQIDLAQDEYRQLRDAAARAERRMEELDTYVALVLPIAKAQTKRARWYRGLDDTVGG